MTSGISDEAPADGLDSIPERKQQVAARAGPTSSKTFRLLFFRSKPRVKTHLSHAKRQSAFQIKYYSATRSVCGKHVTRLGRPRAEQELEGLRLNCLVLQFANLPSFFTPESSGIGAALH